MQRQADNQPTSTGHLRKSQYHRHVTLDGAPLHSPTDAVGVCGRRRLEWTEE